MGGKPDSKTKRKRMKPEVFGKEEIPYDYIFIIYFKYEYPPLSSHVPHKKCKKKSFLSVQHIKTKTQT